MRYRVEDVGGRHLIIGLASRSWSGVTEDKLLVHRDDHGDVYTRMKDADMMHAALYDLFQCEDALRHGDEFETEFGTFYCRSVHVLNAKELESWVDRD